MKNTLLIALPLCVVASLVFTGYSSSVPFHQKNVSDSIVVFTTEVRAILDKKCYGCHSNNSKSAKARKNLNWDSLNLITRKIKIDRLDDIVEVLSEDEMPPKKFLEKEPGAKLTAQEKKLFEEWADSEMNRISKVVKKK